MGNFFDRRQTVTGIGAAFSSSLWGSHVAAQATHEVTLTDEPTRGFYGLFDADYFGPANDRAVTRHFEFPGGVDSANAYGIDISHHTSAVPWKLLKSNKVSYVYIKSSQSKNGRDDSFVGHWQAAMDAGLPAGAYHFLTAGVSGVEQSAYFLRRLSEVGGVKVGHLQPVIDLEWDTFGPAFRQIVVGHYPNGEKKFKDYWDDLSKAEIVATVQDAAKGLRRGVSGARVRPIIYTNKSWWDLHIPSGTKFTDCSVWISDYRDKSYVDRSPRSVADHDYYLWQFTDQAKIVGGRQDYGPFDCNKLVFGGLDKITVA